MAVPYSKLATSSKDGSSNNMQRGRKCNFKILFVAFAVALVVTALLEGHDSYVRNIEAKFYEEHMSQPPTPQSHCRLPNLDPFDPTILRFIKSWPKINCGAPQPPITYVKDGLVHINKTVVEKTKKFKADKLICSHQQVSRVKGDDDKIHLGPKQVFTEAEALPEFSVVSCIEASSKILEYETGYACVKEVPEDLANRSRSAFESGRTNVLIIVLDSMSRLNFIRQLPKTFKFINETLRGITMKGLTKVGDNTYPNMMAMLTGLASSRSFQDKSLAPFWGNASTARGNFDDLPAVWKNFSQHNYVTMFAEDHPKYAAFNYNARGFKKPPTDYYMRPFWLAMEQLHKKLASKDARCYGHIPKHEFLLQYLEDFVTKMETGNHSFFSLAFSTYLSHDHLNSVKVIDDDLVILLKKLEALGLFNNSAVIIMGDHGNRFDDIRSTIIGRVEERMPFMSITLPPSLEHFRENLEQNSAVLTSWHDVYETLMDLALNNTELVSRQLRYGHKGLSLFRPIPKDRTCLQIGIPREYCICWEEKELKPSDAAAIKAGKILLKILNKLILERDPQKKCAPLVFDVVKSAQKLLPSHTVARPDDLQILTRVAIRVKPSRALLEGTLEQKALSEIRLVGYVNRLNKYGDQSSCISDAALTLICYCKH